MSVVAIKCEPCVGYGAIVDWWMAPDDTGKWTSFICGWHDCPLCDGTGIERPPQDQDKAARQAIEGETDEDI